MRIVWECGSEPCTNDPFFGPIPIFDVWLWWWLFRDAKPFRNVTSFTNWAWNIPRPSGDFLKYGYPKHVSHDLGIDRVALCANLGVYRYMAHVQVIGSPVINMGMFQSRKSNILLCQHFPDKTCYSGLTPFSDKTIWTMNRLSPWNCWRFFVLPLVQSTKIEVCTDNIYSIVCTHCI